MGTDVQKRQPWQMVPTTFEEAMNFAKTIAASDLAPKDYKGKPGNVIVAMQMGGELGLNPMQALQNITVINGRPSLWGDALLAVCQAHPDFEWINEHYDESKEAAVCIVKRKNYPEHDVAFTLKDVVAGGYDKKQGPWQTTRKRMMQMRARGFCLRDVFADALKGIIPAEEAMDLEAETATPETTTTATTGTISQVDALKGKLKGDTAEPGIIDATLTENQWAEIQTRLKDHGIKVSALCKAFDVVRPGELQVADIDAIDKWISEQVDLANKAKESAA